jgi:protein-S-isoprenylcysteine O-methyltransferase Ste14
VGVRYSLYDLPLAVFWLVWRVVGLLQFRFWTLAFVLKLRPEERLMSDSFPNHYPRYRAEVPALIPLFTSYQFDI